ncbi:hypothetical protein BC940DRAFT_297575 [Gongronella butleri]|nr:hypothetical protein BC940DRAFT_297575 [Gongronella butleri]
MTLDGDQPPKKSWFINILSHWQPLSKLAPLGTTSTATTAATATATTPTLPISTATATFSATAASIASTSPPTLTSTLGPLCSVPSAWNERRLSQHTIGSSLSDDRFSSSSYQGRSSEEKSRLSHLWTRARRHHPHYPRFHWPHRRQSDKSYSSQYQHQQLQPMRPSIPINIIQDTAHPLPPLSSSYQDPPRRPSSLHPSLPPASVNKRHSITEFLPQSNNGSYTEQYLNSRPSSVIYTSHPNSPSILCMQDGHLIDENEIDDYSLDNGINERPPRWILKHDLLTLALNGNLTACPLRHDDVEKQVLQIGCADGVWCMQLALAHPKWSVIGMDEAILEPISSTYYGKKPRNVKLIRCTPSLLHALRQMPDQMFDLIDGRCLLIGYTFDEYQSIARECWRLCKPNGYIEFIEMDMRIYHTKPLPSTCSQTTHQLNSEVIHMLEAEMLDPRLARRLPDLWLDQDIKPISWYTSLPIGTWAGRLGVMVREEVHCVIESLQPHVAAYLGTACRSDNELDKLLDEMDSEMELQQSFMNLHHCHVQKV